MTREQKHQMLDMRLDGYSLERSGEHFGISRQRVCQIFSVGSERGEITTRKQNRLDRYVFPNIAVWMNENNYSAKMISKELFVSERSFSGYMLGDHDVPLNVINAIIQFTGMPFEVAFERRPE